MAPIKVRAYAERRGVALSAVYNAIQSGRIAKAVRRNEAGKLLGLDPDAADELWTLNTDPEQAERKARAPTPGGDYYEHRSTRERVNAELAQIELEEKLGRLVDAAQAATEFGAVLRRIKDGLLRTFEAGDALLSTNPQNSQIRVAFGRMGRQILEELASDSADLAEKIKKSAPARTRNGSAVARTRARSNGK